MSKKNSYFISDAISVKQSKGKGLGIFAEEDIAKGTIIEVSPSIPVSSDDPSLSSKSIYSHYVYGMPRGRAALGLGYVSLYNHSRNANAETQYSGRDLTVTVKKNIKKGDEIFIDYGWNPDDRRES